MDQIGIDRVLEHMSPEHRQVIEMAYYQGWSQQQIANRTGDDVSGRLWERTRRMGVNTLAFRLAQNRSFFIVDADCVPLTKAIEWKKTSQKNFGLPDEQIAKQPYQFSISANKHGRIMGFFTDNVFHIVWFDHSHSVYN